MGSLKTISFVSKVCFVVALLFVYGCGPLHDTTTIALKIDSEPSGARIYSEGEGLAGTTPLTLYYTPLDEHYNAGVLLCKPLICVRDGYLPQKIQPKLQLDPTTRPNPPDAGSFIIQQHRVFNYHQLFLLEPDSRVAQTQRYDITTRQEDNPLDSALKFGSLMTIIKSLAPTPVP
jgi:hypothetical protein